MPTYQWITEPPVEEVPRDQVVLEVAKFRGINDAAHKSGKSAVEKVGELYDISLNAAEYGASLCKKAASSNRVAFWMSNFFAKGSAGANDYVYKYVLFGRPVGLIHFKKTDDKYSLYIEHLVGHVGTSNAGDILIEYILRFIDENNPVVGLLPLNDKAADVYSSLGFEYTNSSRAMALDLRSNLGKEKWIKIDGRFRLKSGANLKYLTTPTPTIEHRATSTLGRCIIS